MKKLILIALLACSATIAARAGTYTTLVNGFLSGTNTTLVGVSNLVTGTVQASFTNTFNLNTGTGTQANTNLWPSQGFSPQAAYPNTLYAPYRLADFGFQSAGGTALTYRFASTIDGTIWTSNAFSVVVPSGAFFQTNFDTQATPFYALQSIENTNASAVSNLVIEVNGKPTF